MDIVDELTDLSGAPANEVKAVADKAIKEIERLRGTLQKIADIEHEDIPSPKTPTEGIMWTVLAMAVGRAEDTLKEGE